MMNLLDGLVENSTVPSKYVYVVDVKINVNFDWLSFLNGYWNKEMLLCRTICEALLKHEMLTHTRLDKWCQCFELIQRIIGGVDYKVSD